MPKQFDIDEDSDLDGVDSATENSLNGPRVTNLIAALLAGGIPQNPQRYQTFLEVVRCVRKWAKARGLYSNKMGYWGGVNINIAVTLVVQLHPHDCTANLLRKFFSRLQKLEMAQSHHAHQTPRCRLGSGRMECAPCQPFEAGGACHHARVSCDEFYPVRVQANLADFARGFLKGT